MLTFRTASLCLFLLLLIPVIGSSGQTEVLEVIDVVGGWNLKGKQSDPIVKGRSLPAGGQVVLQKPVPGKENFIKIRINGKGWFECRGRQQHKTCDLPGTPGIVERVISSIKRAFEENKVFGDGKGGSLRMPQEAVVKLDQGEMDLSPSLGTLSDGVYCVYFQAIDSDLRECLKVSISNGKNIITSTKELAAGQLYGISLGGSVDKLGNCRCELDGGTDAWVLVVEPDKYSRLTRIFSEVRSQEKLQEFRGKELRFRREALTAILEEAYGKPR
jgi:hypothetical protein